MWPETVQVWMIFIGHSSTRYWFWFCLPLRPKGVGLWKAIFHFCPVARTGKWRSLMNRSESRTIAFTCLTCDVVDWKNNSGSLPPFDLLYLSLRKSVALNRLIFRCCCSRWLMRYRMFFDNLILELTMTALYILSAWRRRRNWCDMNAVRCSGKSRISLCRTLRDWKMEAVTSLKALACPYT